MVIITETRKLHKGRSSMPAKTTAKKTTKKAVKKTEKKPTKTETKPQKGKKLKKGEAYECGICGFRLIVDECGCVEEHYLICCQKAMSQKKAKKAVKKTASKTAKKPTKKTTKKK
jgi:hypothetical protein